MVSRRTLEKSGKKGALRRIFGGYRNVCRIRLPPRAWEEEMIWKTERRKINDLIPHIDNPRKLSDEEKSHLEKSIKKFNLVEIPVINKDNSILAGHQRLKVMQMLGRGDEEIDVRVPVDMLSKEDADEYLIRSNRNHADWDWNLLQQNFDVPDLTDWGFEIKEINLKFDIPIEDETHDIPELSKELRSKRGGIYTLGRHRLMCGDSTNFQDVETLMHGKKSQLCFTDPPYSVDYKSRKENPDQTLRSYQDPKNAKDLLFGFLSIMPSECLIMTYADKQLHPYVLTLEKLGFETIDLLVWKKQNFCFWPGARYQQMHELIFLARKIGSKFYSNTPSNRSTIFEVDRKMSNEVHPTERPVSLWDELLSYHSIENDLIYDPFLGSGTTLISCEKQKRICYGIEISEQYCDVIIKRYCNFTGANEDEIYNSAMQVVQENTAKQG